MGVRVEAEEQGMIYTVLLIFAISAFLGAVRLLAVRLEMLLPIGRLRLILGSGGWLTVALAFGSFFAMVFILLTLMRGY